MKLHPYRQQSVLKRPCNKLAPRFYGPFKILERIGSVAYKLELPTTSRIHPVFHVSLLKRKLGSTDDTINPTLPPMNEQWLLLWESEAVLDMQVVRLRKKSQTQWLIKWAGLPREDATWESAQAMVQAYPNFAN